MIDASQIGILLIALVVTFGMGYVSGIVQSTNNKEETEDVM